ncbi:MAG: TetR/AcrR family transcriptional regulator [Desulfuromonadaceae bacterium]|nr:TetR/AcrR family transcriptional regulator [Desulfuromonadaceae bacterium]
MKQTESTPHAKTPALEPEPQRRRHIEEAAIRLFSKNGYGSVKIGDITEAAGIAKGTFYLYFANKKELLNYCFTHMQESILAYDKSDSVQKEADIVMRMKKRWLDVRVLHPRFEDFTLLLQVASNSEDAEIQEKALECYTSIVGMIIADIAQTRERGLLPSHLQPELAAYALVGTFQSVAFWLGQGNNFSTKDTICSVEKFIRGVLFPPKP